MTFTGVGYIILTEDEYMKIKTKAYHNIQTVMKFLKGRIDEQHDDCMHQIRVKSSDFPDISSDSIMDTMRYLEQLNYIELSTYTQHTEQYHKTKQRYLELESKMNKSIFNQNNCAKMAIRCFTDDGKMLQTLKRELEDMERNAGIEILATPTNHFSNGCKQFGITGRGTIIYQFSYNKNTREVSINKQVFHKCSLNSIPDSFLIAAMKVDKYGDPIVWDTSKREPNKIFNDIKLNKVLSRLFFVPISNNGKTFTFRRCVTEFDISQEKINTKKVNSAIKKLIDSN